MISVIVPAFNAEKTIAACLTSLLNQTVAQQDYEIIVVDDGSTDATADIVRKYSQVRLLSQENQGPAAARNNGVRQAQGDIILFTDADCTVSDNWIEEMTCLLKSNPEVVGAKGVYKTSQKSLVARFVQLEYEDKYDVMKRHKYIDFIDTYSACFRKHVFIKMDGYNRSFPVACAEDVELSFRLANAGYKMLFAPRAIVYHIHPDNFAGYLKKKYKFAYWRILAVRKNPNKIVKDSHTPQTMKLQVLLIPLIVLSLLAGIWMRSFIPAVIVLFVYFATTIPFVFKAVKKDVSAGLMSPVLLLSRSTAQFLGIVHGLLRT